MTNEDRYQMALESIVEAIKGDKNNLTTVISMQCRGIAEKALDLKDQKESATS